MTIYDYRSGPSNRQSSVCPSVYSSTMDVPTIRPPALRLGDTIGIVAPAGPLQHKEAFHQGVATLERLGFRVRYDERIFQSRRYLAGDDVSRAEELMRYFEDPHIQGVLALRGGYGCARLLHLLDERRLRSHCKVFMGVMLRMGVSGRSRDARMPALRLDHDPRADGILSHARKCRVRDRGASYVSLDGSRVQTHAVFPRARNMAGRHCRRAIDRRVPLVGGGKFRDPVRDPNRW